MEKTPTSRETTLGKLVGMQEARSVEKEKLGLVKGPEKLWPVAVLNHYQALRFCSSRRPSSTERHVHLI